MSGNTHPTFGNGKICYIEIPAADITASAHFYATVFGWHTRMSSDGHVSFDDGVTEVSGTWVTGRKPSTGTGIMISIMVDNIPAIIELILANGGHIPEPVYEGGKYATFVDPYGNVFGLYQHNL